MIINTHSPQFLQGANGIVIGRYFLNPFPAFHSPEEKPAAFAGRAYELFTLASFWKDIAEKMSFVRLHRFTHIFTGLVPGIGFLPVGMLIAFPICFLAETLGSKEKYEQRALFWNNELVPFFKWYFPKQNFTIREHLTLSPRIYSVLSFVESHADKVLFVAMAVTTVVYTAFGQPFFGASAAICVITHLVEHFSTSDKIKTWIHTYFPTISTAAFLAPLSNSWRVLAVILAGIKSPAVHQWVEEAYHHYTQMPIPIEPIAENPIPKAPFLKPQPHMDLDSIQHILNSKNPTIRLNWHRILAYQVDLQPDPNLEDYRRLFNSQDFITDYDQVKFHLIQQSPRFRTLLKSQNPHLTEKDLLDLVCIEKMRNSPDKLDQATIRKKLMFRFLRNYYEHPQVIFTEFERLYDLPDGQEQFVARFVGEYEVPEASKQIFAELRQTAQTYCLIDESLFDTKIDQLIASVAAGKPKDQFVQKYLQDMMASFVNRLQPEAPFTRPFAQYLTYLKSQEPAREEEHKANELAPTQNKQRLLALALIGEKISNPHELQSYAKKLVDSCEYDDFEIEAVRRLKKESNAIGVERLVNEMWRVGDGQRNLVFFLLQGCPNSTYLEECRVETDIYQAILEGEGNIYEDIKKIISERAAEPNEEQQYILKKLDEAAAGQQPQLRFINRMNRMIMANNNLTLHEKKLLIAQLFAPEGNEGPSRTQYLYLMLSMMGVIAFEDRGRPQTAPQPLDIVGLGDQPPAPNPREEELPPLEANGT